MVRIAIIGGGFAGIYNLKYCIQEGLECVLFESTNDLGGVWKYRPDQPGGFLKDGHVSSSIHFLHPTDFPFPEGTPEFPHHSVIWNHLNKYVDHFQLREHIILNTKVKNIAKKNNKWIVSYNDSHDEFDKVIVCTGIHQSPAPIPNNFKSFHKQQNIIHSHDYKLNKDKFIDKNILIVGGGETANDIAHELCPIANVSMSIRNGQWFQGKWAGGDEPADLYLNRFMTYVWYPPFRDWVGYLNQFYWGTGGSGIQEWKPSTPYNESFFTKGRECIGWIAKGKLKPFRNITHIEGKRVFFKDKFIEPDYIILCIGYNNKHLDKLFPNEEHKTDRFKLIFSPHDISLAFSGFVRPTLGSLPMIVELQARLISKVYSEKIFLPDKKNMIQTIENDNLFRDEKFKIHHKRLQYLVFYYIYCDQIANLLGCKPNLFKIFF